MENRVELKAALDLLKDLHREHAGSGNCLVVLIEDLDLEPGPGRQPDLDIPQDSPRGIEACDRMSDPGPGDGVQRVLVGQWGRHVFETK